MKLKICGLTTPHDVECVNRAGVDFAGFVFTRHRQQVSIKTAKALKSELNPQIKSVGVFVNEDYAFIKRVVDSGVVDLVQFHGDTEYKVSCPAIRAFRMKSKADIKPTGCDYILFDAFSEDGGSTGSMFDWRLLDGYDSPKPFFIAGGINAANIKQALTLNPYGIDISSGVEERGKKSLKKIMEVSLCIKTYCPR